MPTQRVITKLGRQAIKNMTGGEFVGILTWDAWEFHELAGNLTLGDAWPAGHRPLRAATVAGLDVDDAESWVAPVTFAHRASVGDIRPGDYACCQGYGQDVIFVRLHEEKT